jgi:hypothetical protein
MASSQRRDVGAGEAEVAGTDPPGPPDLPARYPLPQATQYFGHISLAILIPPCRALCPQFCTYGTRERIGSLGWQCFFRGEPSY